MKRAKKVFERKGLIVYPFPVDFKSSNTSVNKSFAYPYNWIPNAQSLSMSSRALRELFGRMYYRSW